MPTGRRQKALRSLGSTVRLLAHKYNVQLKGRAVSGNSSEKEIVRAYRQLCLSVHPDKGGDTADFQALQQVYEGWVRLGERAGGGGDCESAQPAPATSGGTPSALPGDMSQQAGGSAVGGRCALAVHEGDRQPHPPAGFRIHNVAVLLTYSLGKSSASVWPRFVASVESRRTQWCVKHWSATLEGQTLTSSMPT